MDGLRKIGKEITTSQGIWRVVVGLLATLLWSFVAMGLAVLLAIGGLNEYLVAAGMFVVIVLFLHPQWADFCGGMADSLDRAGFTLDVSTYLIVDSLLEVNFPVRAIGVPLTPPRLLLA